MKNIYFTQATQQRLHTASNLFNFLEKKAVTHLKTHVLFLIHWPVYSSNYGDVQSALEMVLTAKALFLESQQKKIHLICPYFPFTMFSKPDTCDELSALVSTLKQANIKQISVLDVHDPQLLENLCTSHGVLLTNAFPNYPLDEILSTQHFGECADMQDVFVVAPDKGAVKRAKAVANQLDVPLVCFQKKRLSHAIEMELDPCEIVLGKRTIVVDDFVLTGKTLTSIVEVLTEKGCTYILALLTHNLKREPQQKVQTNSILCMNDMYTPHVNEALIENWLIDVIFYQAK